MKLHVFSGIAALALCLNAWGQAEVRLAVHKTFKLPKETIARFEKPTTPRFRSSRRAAATKCSTS